MDAVQLVTGSGEVLTSSRALALIVFFFRGGYYATTEAGGQHLDCTNFCKDRCGQHGTHGKGN